jgi:hypothetical protein
MLHEDVANDGRERISHSPAISLLEELVLHLKIVGFQAGFQRPNRIGVFPHLRTETDPVSETLFLLLFRKYLGNGQSPKTQHLYVLCTIVRTL